MMLRLVPTLCALLTFSGLLFFGEKLFSSVEKDTIQWANLYNAIFGWSAIQTGFLFGVYGFVVGSPKGFMTAIQGLKDFTYFKAGIVTSLFVGFLLSIASLPLVVLAPDPLASNHIVSALVYAWFAMFVFAFGTFLKAAYMFAFMTRQKPAQKILG